MNLIKQNIRKSFFNVLYMSIILTILVSCGSDSEDVVNPPIPIPQNQAPAAFSLTGLTNGMTNVDVKPTMSWEVATDPDGDTVTYDFYLDINENPTTLFATNIVGTSFQIQESLDLINEYYWKIVAKDGQGNTTESNIFSFTTRNLNIPNQPVTASANFSGRRDHTTTVFNDKLWVIGGMDNGFNHLNDVWYSNDGISWIEATNSAAFPGRRGHTTIVFDDKLWVIGGVNNINPTSTYFEDSVWYSADGVNWIETTSSQEFLERGFHDTVVFDNKIWLIGGNQNDFFFRSDVWYSSNGINWTEATADADFVGRIDHSVEVFENKLWVIAGRAINGVLTNNVWYSNDGVNWIQTSPEAQFTKRQAHTSVVFGNKLWIMGGRDINGVLPKEVWYSSDGITWTQLPSSGEYPGKMGHTTSIFNDQMWVVGGYDSATANYSNNIWVFD